LNVAQKASEIWAAPTNVLRELGRHAQRFDRTRNKLLSVLHGVLSRQPMVMVAAERPDARFARMVNSNLGRAELRPGRMIWTSVAGSDMFAAPTRGKSIM